MKIDNNANIGQANPSTQQQPADAVDKAAKEQTTGSSGGGDTSSVSPLARQIAEAKQVADAQPDVRADKIAQARERLESGFYDSPGAREVLVDKLASLVKKTSIR